MKDTIKEKFPSIDDETVAGLAEFFLGRLRETINVKIEGRELNPDALHLFSIYTGSMPKAKSEKYIKDFAEIFKPAFNIPALYASYGDTYDGAIVHAFDKEHAYIVRYSLGHLLEEKAISYVEEYNALSKKLLADGYNITFVRDIEDRASITSVEETPQA